MRECMSLDCNFADYDYGLDNCVYDTDECPGIWPTSPDGLDQTGAGELCNEQGCPYWSDWSDWSQCSVFCGGGTKYITRQCKRNGLITAKPQTRLSILPWFAPCHLSSQDHDPCFCACKEGSHPYESVNL